MVFDDSEPVFDESAFKVCHWSEFYPDAAEVIPHDAMMEQGNIVVTSCFVDSDHASCKVMRRSHTGVILFFVNKAPIMWYLKCQNMVKMSTFGSECCAMKTAIDVVEGLCYKLWMMGIPLAGPMSVFCSNESVVKNLTVPRSSLKKHHNMEATPLVTVWF
jgi:hypothetical protein